MSDRMRGARPAVGAKGPDELRQQIEETRSRLGDTVEELAFRADVKGRAKARAAGLKDRAGAMTGHLRSSATQAAHRAQEKATRASHTVQERRAAGHTGHKGHRHADRAGHPGPCSGPAKAQEGAQAGPAGEPGHRMRSPRSLLTGGGTAAALATAGVLIRRGQARRRQAPSGPLQSIRSWGSQAFDKAPWSGTWSWGEQLRRNQVRRGQIPRSG